MMVTKDQVESWILDYSCKYKLHRVVNALAQRCNGQLTLFNVPEIRLVICAFHWIVTTCDINRFEEAIEQLDMIFQCCRETVPFKLYSKLCTGLKMKVLLGKLEKNSKDVLIKLNHYFPRLGRDYVGVKKKEVSKLHSVEMNFRKFFLPLIAHENQRKAYFRDEYQDEYGENFLDALRKLTSMYTDRVEAHLPQTAIERILADGYHTYTPLQEDCPDIAMEMLLDTVQGKTELTDKDLLDLLTMLSPVCTQDRLNVDYLMSLHNTEDRSVGSDSLFSSENSDSKKKQIAEKNSNQNSEHVNNSDLVALSSKINKFDRDKQERGEVPKVNIESSEESLISSDKSVSILTTSSIRKTLSKKTLGNRLVENIPDQVYTITSSSDSNQSQPLSQSKDDKLDKIHNKMHPLLEGSRGDSDVEMCVCESSDEDQNKSVSDIDKSDKEEVIPPSRTEDLEFWDVFAAHEKPESPITEQYQLPSLKLMNPDVKLCIVKLHRREDLDIFKEEFGVKLHMYS